jgi:hypothetical protein
MNIKYTNGEIYDGEHYNGIKNGHGIYTWPDGTKYDGYFKDDERNGHGV